MKKKYAVVSIHYTTECNMNCSFCYKKKSPKYKEKPLDFWYKLVPEIKKISNQIALGGGEPFINIPFVKKLGRMCKNNDVILNITSNGRLLMNLSDKELKSALKDITLISLSFDEYKIQTPKHLKDYKNLIKRIKGNTDCQIGSNLLITQKIIKSDCRGLKTLVEALFGWGCDRVFALCPKNFKCPDILGLKPIYQYLTIKYEHFYVDDLTKMILSEDKYSGWKNVCHRGRDIFSINEMGGVSSCSFAEPFTFLKNPKDLSKIKIPKCEGGLHSCPFLKI